MHVLTKPCLSFGQLMKHCYKNAREVQFSCLNTLHVCLLGQEFAAGLCCVQVLEQFFKVGQEKSGMLNLVIARLCQLWAQPDGTTLAIAMVPTIVSACVFGTVHKKAER